MADNTSTTVTNLDIQLLNANRSAAVTIKLDNPKDDVTREQVSSTFQPALSGGWFLANDGSPAMYIGNITVNQSIKTKLGGEDFYVTPSELRFSANALQSSDQTTNVNVTGATIQGYNFSNSATNNSTKVVISENALTAAVTMAQGMYLSSQDPQFSIILIVQGQSIQIPVYIDI